MPLFLFTLENHRKSLTIITAVTMQSLKFKIYLLKKIKQIFMFEPKYQSAKCCLCIPNRYCGPDIAISFFLIDYCKYLFKYFSLFTVYNAKNIKYVILK